MRSLTAKVCWHGGITIKKVLILLLVIIFTNVPFATAGNQDQQNLSETAPAAIGSEKAGWVGQTVTFLNGKMHQKVGYIFLYLHPGEELSGIDQVLLAKKLSGKSYKITGLYALKLSSATSYFWRLLSVDNNQILWVKDNKTRLMSEEPFALPQEIAAENQLIGSMNELKNKNIWLNKNMLSPGDVSAKVNHLEHFIIKGFESAGPYSQTYLLTLTNDDNETVQWKIGINSGKPVYNHGLFWDQYNKTFYGKDPSESYPNWQPESWQKIKQQKVVLGWDKKMVEMSWGQPLIITQDFTVRKNRAEIWEYEGQRYLYFKKDQLVNILIPKPSSAGKTVKTDKTAANSGLMSVAEAQVD